MSDTAHAQSIACPLCSPSPAQLPADDSVVTCDRCGKFYIRYDLACRIHTTPNLHLLGGYAREYWERIGEAVVFDDANVEEIFARCPQTVKAKADKLLGALQRRTHYFGHKLQIDSKKDYPLGYSKNETEFRALLHYLQEAALITNAAAAFMHVAVITWKGFEAIESGLLSPAVTVFISSTCYDLVDLRAELADVLESKGFVVRVSDDPYRVDVDPTQNSIETCLRNVEAADVIVCILDGRYGPPLPPDGQLSATHCEIKHARNIGKPIYIFGRDKALSDYDQLRKNPDASTLWVEKHDKEQRARWLAFAKDLQALAPAEGYSNWIDPFTTSVQLKKLVLKRLSEFQRKLPR